MPPAALQPTPRAQYRVTRLLATRLERPILSAVHHLAERWEITVIRTEAAMGARDHAESCTLQWLALALTPGLGAGRARKLVAHLGGIERVFNAPLTELEAAGLPSAAAQSLALGRSLELAGDELDRLKQFGGRLIVPSDEGYPRRLLEIYDPPLVLYLRGNLEAVGSIGIAVVGTRHPTALWDGHGGTAVLRPGGSWAHLI